MKRNCDNILVEWLVLEAQSGQTLALEQLIARLYPKLIQYSYRQLGDREAAKEAVQNSFEILARDLSKISDPAAFLAWIYKITHRKGVDQIRQKQRQRALAERIEHEQMVHSNSTQAGDDFLSDNVLDSLGAESYRLVHLYYLEGFNVREIATILSIPQGTVKSRLHQVRQKLKSHLLRRTL